MADHEVDDLALGEGKHVAGARQNEARAARSRDGLLERAGEVFDDDDRLGAGVLERMMNLARRIERVDVHDRHARAQDAENGNNVLQEIGHHDGDAVAWLQFRERLQIGRKFLGALFRIGVAQVGAEVRVARALRELLCRSIEDRRDVGDAVRINGVRNAGWIGAVPKEIGHEQFLEKSGWSAV